MSTTFPIAVPKRYTYDELIAYGKEIATNPGTFSNSSGVLKWFRAFHGLGVAGDGREVGPELDGNCEVALSKYIGHRKAAGIDASIANDKSRMRWWVGVYKRIQQRDRDSEDQKPKATLWETIEYFFSRAKEKNPKLSSKGLSVKIGLAGSFLSNTALYKRRSFKPGQRPAIEKLEGLLDISTGGLTRFCAGDGFLERGAGSNKYRSRLSKIFQQSIENRKNTGENLTLRPWEFKGALKNDWTALLDNKTKNLIPGVDLDRSEIWLLRPIPESETQSERAEIKSKSLDGKYYAPTAGPVLNSIASFLGALRQLRDAAGERSFNADEFRLAYLADSALVGIAADHIEKRRDGFTQSAAMMYKTANTLLLEKFGFIWQQPSYVDALPSPAQLEKLVRPEQLAIILRHELDDGRVIERPTPELFANLTDKERAQKWHAWCNDQRNLLKARLKRLSKDGKLLKKTRDDEAVREYLGWDEPALVLTKMAEAIRQTLDEKSHTLWHTQVLPYERMYIFTLIEENQPLRVQNMTQLLYDDQNEGTEHHLYKRYDQQGKFVCYAIRIKSEHFKNWIEAKEKNYDFDLPTDLNDPLNNYIGKILPKFGYSGTGPFPLFPSAVHKGRAESVYNLSILFRKCTKRMIPGCIGFGPHTCRHLVTTDIILNVPDGRRIAALVLHDQVSTIEANYQHVQGKYGHKKWQEVRAGRYAQIVAIAEEGERKQLESVESFLEKAKGVLGVGAFEQLRNFFQKEGTA